MSVTVEKEKGGEGGPLATIPFWLFAPSQSSPLLPSCSWRCFMPHSNVVQQEHRFADDFMEPCPTLYYRTRMAGEH